MPTRAQLKEKAKWAMRKTKPSVMLIALVYLIIVYVLEILEYKVMFPGMSLYRIYMTIMQGDLPPMSTGAAGQLIRLAIQVMTTMLGIGMTSVCLNVSRFRKVDFGSLFDPFAMFFKLLWLNILMGIYIMLWTLLFIIPGIIASYRYSMAVYIMLDNPEYSASECMRRSKEMMEGKKLDLFVLQLSFIGWQLLTIIPFVDIYVLPYVQTTYANFYNALSGCVIEDYTVHDDNGPSDNSRGGWDSGKDPWD